LAGGVEIVQRNGNALRHSLLTFTHPDTRVVVLLIWLISAIGIANLTLEVVDLVGDVIAVKE
jgi:hypothetical protein